MVTIEDIVQALEGAELTVPVAGLKEDVPLVMQGLDSLDIATLMLALETKYKKPIPPEKAARLRTVADIIAYLNS